MESPPVGRRSAPCVSYRPPGSASLLRLFTKRAFDNRSMGGIALDVRLQGWPLRVTRTNEKGERPVLGGPLPLVPAAF